jgi:AAA domain
MAHHFLDLDAKTIRTREFTLTQQAVDDSISRRAMGLVHGDAGLGKTFAVEEAVRRLCLPTHCLVFSQGTTTKALVSVLLRLITGVPHEGTLTLLQLALRDVLAGELRLIVVDEAQHLNHDCVQQLRLLHDDPETNFALLLVGGNGCWELLQSYAMLRSRLYRRVAFVPLTRERILKAMPGFHPIYRGIDPELIATIDTCYGRGNFRDWAAFTCTAVDLMARLGARELTEQIVQNALALHGEGQRAA